LEIISLIFIFALKIYFYVKMKIKETISNNLDLNKYYSKHDPEQEILIDWIPCVILMPAII